MNTYTYTETIRFYEVDMVWEQAHNYDSDHENFDNGWAVFTDDDDWIAHRWSAHNDDVPDDPVDLPANWVFG